MRNRLEQEFPYVDLRVLPPIEPCNPSDPSGELRRRARLLRASAQQAAIKALWQTLITCARRLANHLRRLAPAVLAARLARGRREPCCG